MYLKKIDNIFWGEKRKISLNCPKKNWRSLQGGSRVLWSKTNVKIYEIITAQNKSLNSLNSSFSLLYTYILSLSLSLSIYIYIRVDTHTHTHTQECADIAREVSELGGGRSFDASSGLSPPYVCVCASLSIRLSVCVWVWVFVYAYMYVHMC